MEDRALLYNDSIEQEATLSCGVVGHIIEETLSCDSGNDAEDLQKSPKEVWVPRSGCNLIILGII